MIKSGVRIRTMTLKTPFFISPAYSVPRITISIRLKLISTDVVEDMPFVKRLAGNWPALYIVKSGSPKLASSSSVGRMSMLFYDTIKWKRSGKKETVTYHEESMIGPGTNDPDFDPVLRIPLGRC